jgi:hypothetical protein
MLKGKVKRSDMDKTYKFCQSCGITLRKDEKSGGSKHITQDNMGFEIRKISPSLIPVPGI